MKNPFFTYYVEFGLNGKSRIKPYRAINPGHAYQKCHREYPGTRLIDCLRQGVHNGEHVVTHYPPPSTVAFVPGPEITAEQTTFDFADQLSFKPKETGWSWDTLAASSESFQKLKIGEIKHG